MLSQERRRLIRKFLTLGMLVSFLVSLSLSPAAMKTQADAACCALCDEQLSNCQQSCIENAPCPGPNCGRWLINCQQGCDSQWNSCISNCGSCD